MSHRTGEATVYRQCSELTGRSLSRRTQEFLAVGIFALGFGVTAVGAVFAAGNAGPTAGCELIVPDHLEGENTPVTE